MTETRASAPDAPARGLDPARLRARLTTSWLGRRHVHEPSCASTNDRAAEEAKAGAAEGLLVTTDRQTNGRGRLGRSWVAPPGENLTFSLLLRPRRPPPEVPPLTLLAGGAVAEALSTLGFAARVKWPNDVLLRGPQGARKVAGILTEATTVGDRIGHVVVGVGINVNTAAFPPELADKATSLRLTGGGALDLVEVLARVLTSFETAYENFRAMGPAAAIPLWEAHADRLLRSRAQIDGRDVEGVAIGVLPDGSLQIRDDDDVIHRVVAGEVSTAG
ncbi:MAG TPA: biotin--[acetyl-CoA-carboxylase] ligase [Polyangia bacterium]|nr:biotin--[acetyl-CoA-carboxylase] ligase [Polyangia bacterium]